MIPRWLKRRGCNNIHLFGCLLLLFVVYKVWLSALNENSNTNLGQDPANLNINKRDNSDAANSGSGSKKAAYRYERYASRNKVNEGSPGELGAAVALGSKEQALADSLFKKEAFNIIASNRLAMNRTLKDLRDQS